MSDALTSRTAFDLYRPFGSVKATFILGLITFLTWELERFELKIYIKIVEWILLHKLVMISFNKSL